MSDLGQSGASDPRLEALLKKHREWVWARCPGCGRRSAHHPDFAGQANGGEFHSDGCPLEGLYGHTHQWWFERELDNLARLLGLGFENYEAAREHVIARLREGN